MTESSLISTIVPMPVAKLGLWQTNVSLSFWHYGCRKEENWPNIAAHKGTYVLVYGWEPDTWKGMIRGVPVYVSRHIFRYMTYIPCDGDEVKP